MTSGPRSNARPQDFHSRRRFPVGAEVLEGEGVHVRVWAPARKRIDVVDVDSSGAPARLDPEPGGYFSGLAPRLRAENRYLLRVDGEERMFPDPASRFQPDGPHGPSQVIDARRFPWTDRDWRGTGPREQVIYELHVGTFTAEGTFASAAPHLPRLRELGVTVIELMPLHEFPGRFGWGYDGVNLWAPTHLYGTPDDVRRFVDKAHGEGIGVILDVVYNHVGPDGNYLKVFSPEYFTDRYSNEWGEALNFDGPSSGPVREFFVANAGYWIEEFHFDGLRLDATQSIHDGSRQHVLADIGRRVRAAAGGRETLIVAENEPQESRLVRPEEAGGYGLDALWNDDFHHTAHVALTGSTEAYYTDYAGSPQEIMSAIRWGYLYQGQRYRWQKKARGSASLDLRADHLVTFLENHDQVANSARGARLVDLAAPGRLRAMTAVMLLAPGTPMLFQGQEFGSRRPFLYFADHRRDLAAAVAKGRREFLAQFSSLASSAAQERLLDPSSEATFESCKLEWSDAELRSDVWNLHRDLLRLRRRDDAFRQQRADAVSGAVLGREAFVLRYFCPAGDRLLLVNLGKDLPLEILPEPLLAPPIGCEWTTVWSSEEPAYGGAGTAPLEADEGWRLAASSARVLAPRPAGEAPPTPRNG
jgi:maltooligosyltrehalose trehalohydrolase